MTDDVAGDGMERATGQASARSSPPQFEQYAVLLADFVGALPPGWRTWTRRTPVLTWRLVGRRLPRTPQGWKLHVSVASVDAVRMVAELLPELLSFDVLVKLPDRLAGVIHLNSARAGPTQLGKVVTVYPASDGELGRVVDRLDAVWASVPAPAIPSDLRVGRSGNLWVRYGSFDGDRAQVNGLGVWEPVLATPEGELAPDVRSESGAQPRWAPEPPVAAVRNPAREVSAPVVIGGDRYLPFRVLSDGPARRVVLCVRLRDAALGVVKEGVAGVDADELGNDAASRVRNEYAVLRSVEGSRCCPEPIAADLTGSTVARLVTADLGGTPYLALPPTDRLSRLHEVAATTARLHAAGFVHRDLKLANVIVAPDGVRLVDLELAARAGERDPIPAGTSAYVAPEGRRAVVAFGYDSYSMGSCLTHAVLGSCPSRLPARSNAGRQVAMLHLAGQHVAAALVTAAHQEAADRRPSMAALRAELVAATPAMLDELARRRPGVAVTSSTARSDARWARSAALAAGAATRRYRVTQERGHLWRNLHLQSDHACEAVNIGAAGIVLGLATVDTACGTSAFGTDIAGAADWLAARGPAARAHGLFTGNSGVALALATAGLRSGRPELVDAAATRYRAAATSGAVDPDLFSGVAGVLWAGTTLARLLGADWPLEVVDRSAQHLRRSRTRAEGVVAWAADPAYDDTGRTYVGAAHGSCGIALGLAAWGRATGDDDALGLARDVFASVYEHGRTTDGSNIVATSSGSTRPAQYWCHGVAGLLWCVLQAFPDPEELGEVKDWAAESFLAAGSVIDNPTLCHGVAGQLETARMLERLPRWASHAERRRAELVRALRVLHVTDAGSATWTSEEPSVTTPDLWVGFTGPAAAIAMAGTGTSDSVLSPAWLGRCATAGPSRHG